MPTSAYKRCSKCDETKLLAEFHKGTCKDGHHTYCKVCNRANARAWERANRDRARASQKQWQKANAERVAELKSRWEKENPERVAELARERNQRDAAKQRARKVVTNGVRDGKIHKPDTCEDCGKVVPSRQLHAHHKDYSQPLDIEWLCRWCHEARHMPQP